MSSDVTPKKRRIPRWPFVLLLLLAAIAGTGYYYYNKYIAQDRWKPLLQQQLKELVLRSSDSLYHIEYSDFDLNLTSGDATLKDFKMVPDTAVYQKMVANRKAPDNLFRLSVKELSIKNVGAKKAYQEKILEINNISIDKPAMTIISKRYDFNDTVKVGRPKTPYEVMKKVFKRLHIDSISLKDINVNYINKNDGPPKHTALKHLDINISDVMIDSLSSKDPSRFYYTKGVDVTLHGYKMATPDSLYYLNLKQIFFSTAQRKIVLDKVDLLPRYNKTEFYKVVGESKDRYTLKFKQIAINDIDLQRFLREQKVYAGVMNVYNANVEIYNNNAYHGKKSSKIGKDPHQALQKVALDMKLARLNVINSNIAYSEADEKSGYTGTITFNHTSGVFRNVTNDPDVKRNHPFMTAAIQTRFMNAANMNVNFKFNLTAKNGAFNYSGSLGKFDGRVLDKLVKPLAMVHVQSADVDRLVFNVDASNYAGKGSLQFYYHNLNVQLLKKVEGQKQLQNQNFISQLANDFIIEDNNPDKKGHFRNGPIDLKREPTTSFFTFLYKALLDGLKPSVGYDKKTETKVNNTIDKVSNLLDKYHQFMDKRRERREERKKEREAKKQAREQEKQQKELDKQKQDQQKEQQN